VVARIAASCFLILMRHHAAQNQVRSSLAVSLEDEMLPSVDDLRPVRELIAY
jgi:hypothetical protein